jgi:serine/threonine-protein kinase RsbW
MRHGNHLEESRRVGITFQLAEGVLEVCVHDEGIGFDPAALRNPLDDENLLRADGRGVFFMRSFMDEVKFSFSRTQGTSVTMVKRLGSPAVRPGGERP